MAWAYSHSYMPSWRGHRMRGKFNDQDTILKELMRPVKKKTIICFKLQRRAAKTLWQACEGIFKVMNFGSF